MIMIAIVLIITLTKDYDYSDDVWYQNDIDMEDIPDNVQGKSQTVAVIDTGLSAELLDRYSDRILHKYNVIDDNEDVEDIHGHGTEVTSAIGLKIDDELTGVAKECNFIIIKALGDDGKGNNEYLTRAIEYAIDKEATIINISSGGFKCDAELKEAVNKAIDNNISIVAAAGDYGNKDILYPAAYDNVISVTSSDKIGELWENSNISKECDIIFPGVDIKVLSNNEDITEVTGTSLSAALVSGCVARIRDYEYMNKREWNDELIFDKLKEYIFDLKRYTE